MGIPQDKDRQAATYDWGGLIVRSIVTRMYGHDTRILDVGAGWGKYVDLLPEYPYLDACEVWLPYIIEEQLWRRYHRVYPINITTLIKRNPEYDLVIMSDVFEHLSVADARSVLDYFFTTKADMLIVVPFEYPQGIEEDNPYEEHLQDDLTPGIMGERYPELSLVSIENREVSNGDEIYLKPYKGLYRRAF